MLKSSSIAVGHLACFVAYAIFGFNIVVCKDLTTSGVISPIALFCIRSVCAGLMFWVISFFMPHENVDRKDYLKIFAASLLGFFLTQITFLVAISEITPMDCAIVSSMSPVYTMIIAAIVLREPITVKKAGGVILSFAGILYLIFNSAGTVTGVTESTPTGVLLMVLNSLCFSLYLGAFKTTILKYSVVTFMKWIFLFATIMSYPLAASELSAIDFTLLSGEYISELMFLVVCATFITYFLIPIGQKRIRPTLVSMYSYVQPIIAIGISIYVGMDMLSWQKAIAGVVVFGGVVMVSYSRSAQRVGD